MKKNNRKKEQKNGQEELFYLVGNTTRESLEEVLSFIPKNEYEKLFLEQLSEVLEKSRHPFYVYTKIPRFTEKGELVLSTDNDIPYCNETIGLAYRCCELIIKSSLPTASIGTKEQYILYIANLCLDCIKAGHSIGSVMKGQFETSTQRKLYKMLDGGKTFAGGRLYSNEMDKMFFECSSKDSEYENAYPWIVFLKKGMNKVTITRYSVMLSD